MEQIEILFAPQDEGQRIDKFISENCGISRGAAQQLIDGGHVLVGGKIPVKSRRIQSGEALSITIPPPEDTRALPQDIPLDIHYEDEHLLVVDKPKGMVVHPAPGNPQDTLVNALLAHCRDSLSGIGGEIRPGIVHRIDKDTSGLLVVAKNDATHIALSDQFARHSITRVYQAIVYGRFKDSKGEIDAPIGRSQNDRKKMAVTLSHSKNAVTSYRVVAEYPAFSHLELRLQTGRTHQIRVHMASTGHPVAGDPLYGPKKVIKSLNGQCLHAGTLGFLHPVSGAYMEYTSPLPAYFQGFIHEIEGGQ